MSKKMIETRVLGTTDFDAPETREEIKKKIKLASNGAFPFGIREMMKQHGWAILGSDADENEKEKAKLLICYSWWARALDGGIPKRYFEAYILDHLKYLDSDRAQSGIIEKWKKYG